MIKIKSLKVENFKSLIKTEIEKFGDVNLFFGFNNSGKSNIFKFLNILFSRKKIETKVSVTPSDNDSAFSVTQNTLISNTNFWNGSIWNEPFLFSKDKRDTAITFEIQLELSNDCFPQQEILTPADYLGADNTEITLDGTITSVDHETSSLKLVKATLNGKNFYKFEDEIDYFFENDNSADLDSKLGESILQIFNDLILFIDSDRYFRKETSKEGVDIFDIENFKKSLFELYINADKYDKFLDLLKFLSEFDFSDDAKIQLGKNVGSFPFTPDTNLGFGRFNSEIEIMLTNLNGRFPLKNFGTGIQQFLFILTKISQSKSRIVIIEELELNLSPLYQKELLRFLKTLMPELFDQLLFSSHSPFFTKKDAVMIDIVQHVVIDLVHWGGTSVDSHDDILDGYDEDANESVLSRFYS